MSAAATRPLVVITGANRGIGLALAKDLHAAHFDVLLTARDPAKATDAVASLKKQDSGPETLEAATLDTSDGASISRFVQSKLSPLVQGTSNRPIYLVNNAGVKGTTYRPTLTTNVVGPLKLTQAFGQLLKASPSSKGAVVNLSSAIANTSHQIESGAFDRYGATDNRESHENYPYNFSKHLLNIATELFAKELPDVPTIAVDPGWVKTDMGGPKAIGTVQSAVDRITYHLKAPFEELSARSGKVFIRKRSVDWRNM
ncbi:hypothetical protein DFS34DRAFT_583670 [Phlyctochytrium arcticum]|nr:hypothetical protein DFS34DRAFT_583670 [Phlyctochytrium arcticum]